MALQIGQCGLCLTNAELHESHLLPAALYKMFRNPSPENDPNPAVTTRTTSFTSSRQVVSPFLCGVCEHRFSQNGESYVLDQCARGDDQFKLRELLLAATPLGCDSERGISVYDAQSLLGRKINPYLYFAASVFWRASAHRWKMGSEPVAQISLGSTYQEQFRLYLLGKEAFPDKARLVVHVSSEEKPHFVTVFPCATRTNGVPRHKFYIPGLLFILFLSGHAVKQFDGGALNGSKQQLIWVCPWEEDSLFYGSVRLVKASTPTGKLRRKNEGARGLYLPNCCRMWPSSGRISFSMARRTAFSEPGVEKMIRPL